MIYVSIGIGGIITLVGVVAYYVGYLKGYRAGLKYGNAGLEKYHQHIMRTLDNMKVK